MHALKQPDADMTVSSIFHPSTSFWNVLGAICVNHREKNAKCLDKNMKQPRIQVSRVSIPTASAERGTAVKVFISPLKYQSFLFLRVQACILSCNMITNNTNHHTPGRPHQIQAACRDGSCDHYWSNRSNVKLPLQKCQAPGTCDVSSLRMVQQKWKPYNPKRKPNSVSFKLNKVVQLAHLLQTYKTCSNSRPPQKKKTT